MQDEDFEVYRRTEWPNETKFSWPIVRWLHEPKVIVLERNGRRLRQTPKSEETKAA